MKTRVFVISILALLLVAFGCASKQTKPEAAERSGEAMMKAEQTVHTAVPLIERDALFGNPDKAGVQISPDGARIAFIAPLDGVLNIWVGPAGDPDAAKPITKDTGRGITHYAWTFMDDLILYVQDKDGNENWRLFGVNPETGETRAYTPEDEKVQARISGLSHKKPDEALVSLNQRNPQLHDLYHLNLKTGELTLLLENPGFAGFMADDTFTVRFAIKPRMDGGFELLKRTDEGEWEDFYTIEAEDAMNSDVIGFNEDNTGLYLVSSKGRDKAALVEMDIASGEQRFIAEDPMADITAVMRHPTKKTPQAFRAEYLRNRRTILDDTIKEDMAVLEKLNEGDLWITSRSLDDMIWIVAIDQDNGPVLYYLYDRNTKKADFLFVQRSRLKDLPLTKMHPVVIESRDGLELVSYLSLPVWDDHDARPAKPLPMVLYVHGGPWARDSWGYNPVHQWLTNRGYAVLSVNYRGSTGFGKAFVNAADKQWGAKMHDDLLDAVAWAVEQRIADPKRVAIFGGSYGGYATLVGMTFTPELFACGVDIVGPSNLVTFMNSIPPYWQPVIELFAKRIGDHRTEEGRAFLMSRSPISRVDAIARPLLIGQGANDPRVVQAESDQIVSAMQKKDIPVTYVLYPDEGHGFVRPENRLSFFALSDIFLGKCLGGRSEAIGDDLSDSSLQVKAGADIIDGLPSALEAMKAKPQE